MLYLDFISRKKLSTLNAINKLGTTIILDNQNKDEYLNSKKSTLNSLIQQSSYILNISKVIFERKEIYKPSIFLFDGFLCIHIDLLKLFKFSDYG